MTSPPKQITVECPKCDHEYRDWCRPSINLDLDDFDQAEIDEATTTRCPRCGTTVELDSLIAEGADGRSPHTRREAVAAAMETLLQAERDRHAAISELKALGAIRSRSILGEIGEEMAAAYYQAERALGSNPGYDIVLSDGTRVRVKTLRSTPTNRRTSIGVLQPDYDKLLAIRLNADYEPCDVIEVPKEVVQEHFGQGRVSWTRRLERDPRTKVIPASELRLFE